MAGRLTTAEGGKLIAAVLLTALLAVPALGQTGPPPDIVPLQDYGSASPGMMSLPLNELPLVDLRAFRSPGANWRVAGGAYSDYREEYSLEADEGTGVLVNIPTKETRSELRTELEHGDIELKIEFMVPKGSNSGIYLQGRYELQILDSWGLEKPTYGSLGGVYQRWDPSRGEGQEGYEGKAAAVNASLAPGLWQEYHVLFRAPRFDERGKKTRNARFEKVFLNGTLIHEDVEVTGPTRGAISDRETELAPLMIQGSHGPLAFRNIRYRTFSRSDSLRLGPLSYTVYDYRGALLPDREAFKSLPVLAEGVSDSLNVRDLSPREERFAIWFSGDLHVPVSGEYLFQTLIGTGGNLYIDGELVTTTNGRTYLTLVGNVIYLEEGTHQLEISYFKRRFVDPLTVIYEGPCMERRTLASKPFDSGDEPSRPEVVPPEGRGTELYAGFIRYGPGSRTFVHDLGRVGPDYMGFADPESEKKRMHVLAVADPASVHYAYDLAKSSLLKFWRGPFANVATVWHGRGEHLLTPMSVAIANMTGIPIARLKGDGLRFFQDTPRLKGLQVPEGLGVRKYILDDAGRPTFHSNVEGVAIEDEISPAANGRDLVRVIRYSADEVRDDVVSIIARGNQIDPVSDNLYRVENYYVHLDDVGGDTAAILDDEGMQSLAVPVLRTSNESQVRYRIIW